MAVDYPLIFTRLKFNTEELIRYIHTHRYIRYIDKVCINTWLK